MGPFSSLSFGSWLSAAGSPGGTDHTDPAGPKLLTPGWFMERTFFCSFTPRLEKVAVWAEIAASQLAPQMSCLMDTQTFPRSCIGKANNPSCCISFPSHSGAGCSLEMRPAAKSHIALRVPPFKVPLSLHPFSSPLHLFIYLFYHLGFYEMLAGFLQPVAFLE